MIIFGILLLLVGYIGVMIYYGFVLSVLWSWFIAPTFAVPELSIPVAIGISLTIGFVRADALRSIGSDFSSGNKQTQVISALLAAPLFSLLIGWVVKGFM